MARKNKKTNGSVLIITEERYPEFCKALSFKNKKIKVFDFKEAAKAVESCNIDIILLDCSYNVDEGLNILKNNKSMCPNIPNIFITKTCYQGLVLKVFRSGARDFFMKPLNIFELQNTANNLLAVKENSKELRCPFVGH